MPLPRPQPNQQEPSKGAGFCKSLPHQDHLHRYRQSQLRDLSIGTMVTTVQVPDSSFIDCMLRPPDPALSRASQVWCPACGRFNLDAASKSQSTASKDVPEDAAQKTVFLTDCRDLGGETLQVLSKDSQDCGVRSLHLFP